jgi:hypothetical protein
MADIKICDRCGTHIVGLRGPTMFAKGYKYFSLVTESYYSYGNYDLCPSCMAKFEEFMKGDGKNCLTEATDE